MRHGARRLTVGSPTARGIVAARGSSWGWRLLRFDRGGTSDSDGGSGAIPRRRHSRPAAAARRRVRRVAEAESRKGILTAVQSTPLPRSTRWTCRSRFSSASSVRRAAERATAASVVKPIRRWASATSKPAFIRRARAAAAASRSRENSSSTTTRNCRLAVAAVRGADLRTLTSVASRASPRLTSMYDSRLANFSSYVYSNGTWGTSRSSSLSRSWPAVSGWRKCRPVATV